MYGVIFDFLRDYVIEKHGGRETWSMLLEQTGQSPYKIYFPVKEYPDEEIVALATQASQALRLPIEIVLEDFGKFVGHKLVSFYHMYIKDQAWKTLDIVESAGTYIHDALHKHNPLRKPPVIRAKRISADALILHYTSQRRLCHVVRGIVAGLAQHFGEKFEMQESQCMHAGAAECVFQVRRVAVVVPIEFAAARQVSGHALQA
jgi:predicted hydrocarbon binding protein